MSVFTGEFTSKELNRNVVVRVVYPDSPFDLEQLDTCPKTMYLLHGYTGSSGDWIRFTRLEYFARLYNFHVVMADAGNSFYSNMVYGGQYLHFFGEELPSEINKKFKLPEKTFICGQSMGGHGCVKVGLNYPDNYKAIGCLSGAVRFQSIAENHHGTSARDIGAVLGENMEFKEENDCFKLAEKAMDTGKKPYLFQICGTEDFLYEDNVKFDLHLKEIGYPHEFVAAPGAHLWSFWEQQMPELMKKLCTGNF
ncbi:hypothetical protein H8S23_10295 [Anaerofilum sp. BX8]|uniref:S-formylglutathione hydrolase FrmB n=1 Tax=Anaerofilum hominis TaxID=2763016 RepID=A0A923I8P3_9FIRM|nr:alpha/beta hydrolase-fold protein [Anaerofilum hominis]MBC5581899.1 hypothetical protein [Anaerofilum hominis]